MKTITAVTLYLHARSWRRRVQCGNAAPCRAFTLVEVLAVIGIIGVLIAMLLPALGLAREQAQRVQCSAKLRQIGLAALMHANAHQGYLPSGGYSWNLVGGVTNPRGLEDEAERKYEYYIDNGIKRPVPTTVALGRFLGVTCRTDSRENLEQDMAGEPLRRLFRCPSQQAEYLGITQRGQEEPVWTGPEEFSSYLFNAALLGRRDYNTATCPKGKLSRVRDTTRVFFALDGRPRDQHANPYLSFADDRPDETLYDVNQVLLEVEPTRGREGLDFARHRGRIQVVFCDGHVESLPMGIPPHGGDGLKEIYVSRGISY